MIYGHPKHLLSESEAVQALTSYSGIAVITTAAAGRLEATHLPVIFEPPTQAAGLGTLIGHLARGNIRTTQDPEKLRAIVERLTQRQEASQNAPWQITDAPARYIEQQLAGIIGIEVEISEISAKRKMSQEKSAADRQGVIANLNCSDDAENNKVGALMAQLETRQ